MRKITKYLAASAMLAIMLPGIALAHNGQEDNNKNNVVQNVHILGDLKAQNARNDSDHFRAIDIDRILKPDIKAETSVGVVTAIGVNSFTLKADNGVIYNVDTTNATISLPFQGKAVFSDMKVNDQARVQGTINGTAIVARSVVDLPVNKQAAVAKGTITAVSGSTLTVQTKGNNTVTVNTNSNTSVTKADGTVGASSDVQVGAMVKIKGLWDSVLNVLSAIKIHLK